MPDRSPYSVKLLLLHLADLERREQTARDLSDDGGELDEDPGLMMSASIVVSRRELRKWPDVQRFIRDCEAAGHNFDAAGTNQWVALVCKVHDKLPDEVANWNLDEFCDLADVRIAPTLDAAANRIVNPEISGAIADADKTAYRPGDASTATGIKPQNGSSNEPPPCYVTLRQMAAIVNREKRTLERLVATSTLPTPAVEGGGGKPNEWRWSDVRPILESEYGRPLPDVFPADRFVR